MSGDGEVPRDDESIAAVLTRLTTRLREVLADLDTWRARTQPVRAGLARYDWSAVAPADDAALGDLVARATAGLAAHGDRTGSAS